MKKILKGSIIILIIFIELLFIIYNKQAIDDNIPIRCLLVKSNSMYPVINKKDIVIVKQRKEYYLNDIITYIDKNSNLITHRIIRIENEGYITKGDNNNSEDEEIIKKENIKGKIILILTSEVLIKVSCLFIVLIILYVVWKGYKNEEIN